MLMTQKKKLEHKRIIELIKDMNVPKEYCGRQESIKLSGLIKGEPPFYIPDNFGIGGILVVGNRDGDIGAMDGTFVGALRNEKNRKEIKKINKYYDDDYLKKAAYFQYNFKIDVKAETAKKIQAFVFCKLLDILKPSVVIVFGSLSYLAKKDFEEIARKIWPELKNAPNGVVLKWRYNVQGLKELDEVKKERELMEIRHLLNELGHAIANVHDIFKFVEEEVDSDVKKDYFEDYAETCEQKLKSQDTLLNQWGKLRTKKYLLEQKETEDANKRIEDVETMCELIGFLDKREKVLSYTNIQYAMSCIKWIRANEIYCNDVNKFYDLLECALDKEKQKCCSDDRMKTYLREMPKREGGSRGYHNKLDAIYKFLVTVTTRENSLCADLMEHSFLKDEKFSGLQDSNKWKDEDGCWKEGTKFWLPKLELMKKKVDWRHINWRHFLEEN